MRIAVSLSPRLVAHPTNTIPPYIEDFAKDTLAKADVVSQQPYIPYSGDRVPGR